MQWPTSFTHELGWVALLAAYRNNLQPYRFHYKELQLLAAFSGCRVKVHTYFTNEDPPDHHELGDYEFMPGLHSDVQVILRLSDKSTSRGHVLRPIDTTE